jgi:hypothetical protein
MTVSFGTPGVTNIANVTTSSVALTGVTTGQPILLWLDEINNQTVPNASNISDTFDTPYTWVKVGSDAEYSSHARALYIGTGGAGTSGTISITNLGSAAYVGLIAVSCFQASIAAGLGAIDQMGYGGVASGTTVIGPSITPGVAGEGAAYFVGTGDVIASEPSSPWANYDMTYAGSAYASAALQADCASGSPITFNWTQNSSVPAFAIGVLMLNASPPSAPVLSGTAGDSVNVLNWTIPAANGAVLTDYSLLRGLTSGGESATPIYTGTLTTYTDTGLSDGTDYFYEVYATNAIGNGADSNEISLTPTSPLSGLPNVAPPGVDITQTLVRTYVQTGPPIGWGPTSAGRGERDAKRH